MNKYVDQNLIKKPLKISALCPCGSRQTYGLCCRKFIEEECLPERPEQLMRSRYTAYTQGNMDYIQQTMVGRALKGFDPQETRQWALTVKWKKLSVLKTGSLPAPGSGEESGAESGAESNKAYVEFVATYQESRSLHELREKSEFLKQDGRWFYSGVI